MRNIDIHASQQGKHKAGGLAAAVVCLGHQIAEGWGEDHGQRLRLNPGWPLELHLIVQALHMRKEPSE